MRREWLNAAVSVGWTEPRVDFVNVSSHSTHVAYSMSISKCSCPDPAYTGDPSFPGCKKDWATDGSHACGLKGGFTPSCSTTTLFSSRGGFGGLDVEEIEPSS